MLSTWKFILQQHTDQPDSRTRGHDVEASGIEQRLVDEHRAGQALRRGQGGLQPVGEGAAACRFMYPGCDVGHGGWLQARQCAVLQAATTRGRSSQRY